jgi:hypothetical protein
MKTYNIPLKEIKILTDQIHAMKDKRRSTKNLSVMSSHYLGKIGEHIFCEEYKDRYNLSVNMELLLQGDGKYDFLIEDKQIDIKTTTYWKEPLLKEFTSVRHVPDIYVLISIKEILEEQEQVVAEINGACTGSYLIKKKPERLANMGLRYLCSVNELKEFSTLI